MHEEAELAKIRGEMTKTKIGRDSIGSNSPEVAAQASETEKKSGDRQRSSKKEKRQPTTHTHNTDDDDAGHSPEGRFVHALVDVSPSCTAGMGAAAGKELLLFGGISAEQDYQDSHVLSFQSLAV